ncbi:Pyruvate dehydrogenase complex repressor [Sulfitobacter sp. DSM 110093]|uniref:FadR/GntR family transcriptional regulator n=1 Tax=Sulfitobacter sp. DSM 110093 TaxID=2883127 RepID=UPI001FAD9193|nr:FadR/GntR family transcriptional regulator [Sulfitobacter sp. DSM 110093]UOA32840.1 Pyruvate dehydrogenase complex repressor [Sulfitobacter sp. DSM 110093]
MERTVSKSENIVAYFRNAIILGEMKPGDRLLNERELAKQLNVGRPLLREVVRSLAILGVLETRIGDGTYVARMSLEAFSEYFTFFLAQNDRAFSDIIQARIAIECQAVRLACSYATAEDLGDLQQGLTLLRETALDPIAGADAEAQFHSALVRASHSPSLNTVYQAISELMKHSFLWRRQQSNVREEHVPALIEVHLLVYKAIVLKKEDEAEQRLREHFEFNDKLEVERQLQEIAGRE